ncbi:MAG: hypothetical protein Q7S04_01145 [Candidatus Moranbacteria bacterium]|nr:hypothetical protein [Candidatus Moranbacteria bacterium]
MHNEAEQPRGPVDPKPTIPHTAWGKARVLVERDHRDPSKLDPVDLKSELSLQATIDQIKRADMGELMEIQRNIADVLEKNEDPKDHDTIEKLRAVYQRSQELLRVDRQQ